MDTIKDKLKKLNLEKTHRQWSEEGAKDELLQARSTDGRVIFTNAEVETFLKYCEDKVKRSDKVFMYSRLFMYSVYVLFLLVYINPL